MIYFLLLFLLVLGCLIFSSIKGLGVNLRDSAPPLFIYSLFLFFISYCVFDYKMSLISYVILLILSCFFFSFIFSYKKLKLYILSLKSFYLFIVSFLLICSLSELIFSKNIYILLERDRFTVFLFTISTFFYIVFEILLYLYLNGEKLNYLFSSLQNFIPISVFILLISKNFSLIYILLFSRHSLLVTSIILASTLLEISFGIFAIIGISSAYTLSIYHYKNTILNMQYNLQIANLNMLEEYQYDIRRISHDIKNHKTVMYKLLSDGEYEEALKYLNDYGSGFTKKEYEVLTNNKILNAILLSKKDICMESNIAISLDISIPKEFGISDFDLCIIVGNLMDNGIEACKNVSKDSFIDVKCAIINDNFVFEMKNSFHGTISVTSDRFLTSKKDKINHGLGISNIQSTVKKYYGTLNLTFNENVFTSFVMIPINTQNTIKATNC